MHCEWILNISAGNGLALGAARNKSSQMDSAVMMADAKKKQKGARHGQRFL